MPNNRVKRRWYLSFVKDHGFAGACVVWGSDVGDAVREARRLNINPGGEVAGLELGDNPFPMNTLLNREQLESITEMGRLGDQDEETRIAAEEYLSRVCDKHNT
jgi:hypothetical protein